MGPKNLTVLQGEWCSIPVCLSSSTHFDISLIHGSFSRSFWTLSGAPNLLAHQPLAATAMKHGCTPEQALFKLAQTQGITPLSGTTDEKHMQEDIVVGALDIEPEEFSDVLSWMGLK